MTQPVGASPPRPASTPGSQEDFRAFRETFLAGRAEIQRAAAAVPFQDRREGDAVHGVAAEQLEKLRATEYGGAMLRDETLVSVQETLEGGMSAWVRAWAESVAADGAANDGSATEDMERLRRWSEEACFEEQRSHEFWGRFGCILHHYRDRGRSLSTHWERHQREYASMRADALRSAVQALVADPLVTSLYRESTLASLDRLARACEKLREDLATSPLEIDAGPDPFHDSDGLVRAQFCTAFGLLALELYGHLTTSTLEAALDIKSGTVEQLGLVPWGYRIAPQQTEAHRDNAEPAVGPAVREPLTEESRSAILRKAVGKVLTRGLALGERRGWITLPLVRFYAASPPKRRDMGADERARARRAPRDGKAAQPDRLDVLLAGRPGQASDA